MSYFTGYVSRTDMKVIYIPGRTRRCPDGLGQRFDDLPGFSTGTIFKSGIMDNLLMTYLP
jgi:hypothetical protein